MLSKKAIHLDNPGKDEVILGQTLPSFTGAVSKGQMEISDRIKRVAASASREINRKVENATQLITGGKGGYVVLDVDDPDTGKRSLPWRILIMDTPDKETATSVIQLNKNGIGFSRTGINGPYDNAWTIDGNLVADFITTGTMLADRIRGGILEVGGAGLARDGSIAVKNVQGEIIGTWDKTGLHVLLGVIEGSTIKGSKIIGGSINIGDGTFEVDSDGSVIINSGEINIGNVMITQNYTWLGDFGISSTGDGLFYSRDSGHSVQIYSISYPDMNGPAIVLTNGNYTTRLGYGSLDTYDITLQALYDEYGPSWISVSDNIIELWNRLIALENSI